MRTLLLTISTAAFVCTCAPAGDDDDSAGEGEGEGEGDAGEGEGEGEGEGVPDTTMSFFVTSRTGDGNLGGLAGADDICAALADAAGVPDKTWRAYLSALDDATFGRVDARDRIGDGPWFNVDGDLVATSLDELLQQGVHRDLGKTEQGVLITFATAGDDHDILTGTASDGTLGDPVLTCADWTDGSDANIAWVGHVDWTCGDGDCDGTDQNDPVDAQCYAEVIAGTHVDGCGSTIARSWALAHETTGCSLERFADTASQGRFYCFALGE